MLVAQPLYGEQRHLRPGARVFFDCLREPKWKGPRSAKTGFPKGQRPVRGGEIAACDSGWRRSARSGFISRWASGAHGLRWQGVRDEGRGKKRDECRVILPSTPDPRPFRIFLQERTERAEKVFKSLFPLLPPVKKSPGQSRVEGRASSENSGRREPWTKN